DFHVTGVQTCALPICFHQRVSELLAAAHARRIAGDNTRKTLAFRQEAKELWVQTQNAIEPRLRQDGDLASIRDFASKSMEITGRSEERRVGKEWRAEW